MVKLEASWTEMADIANMIPRHRKIHASSNRLNNQSNVTQRIYFGLKGEDVEKSLKLKFVQPKLINKPIILLELSLRVIKTYI